jgi:hypothetical protein
MLMACKKIGRVSTTATDATTLPAQSGGDLGASRSQGNLRKI